jgi:hypothetical protein
LEVLEEGAASAEHAPRADDIGKLDEDDEALAQSEAVDVGRFPDWNAGDHLSARRASGDPMKPIARARPEVDPVVDGVAGRPVGVGVSRVGVDAGLVVEVHDSERSQGRWVELDAEPALGESDEALTQSGNVDDRVVG